MSTVVRIGNAQAFWGDRSSAAAEMLAREPELDFLTLDYLAEVSMSILAVQRDRDPAAGFARDFLDVIRSLAPYWAAGGRCRLVTNAGGLNPQGCAAACRAELEAVGCWGMTIGIVTGDDVLATLQHSAAAPNDVHLYRHLDTGEPIGGVVDRLVTANAYVGAAPIVDALARGADIVITGRTADPSLTVAACVHHFGWARDDWPRIAGATVAGHLIECGTQVTGGISTDWLDVPDPGGIGFPIVEVAEDGRCVVTKPRGSGGRVTEQTVKEQLLYEIGDPGCYLSPDATVSFLSLSVTDLVEDRVRVSGASGGPPPSTFKVSATYRDGYRAAGTLTVVGRDAVAKAERVGEIVLQRVAGGGHQLRDAVVECLGRGDSVAGVVPRAAAGDAWETVLRIGVEAASREAVECFSRELMPLVTAGPQGVCGYADGRPNVQPVVRYWPCLIERSMIVPQVIILEVNSISQGRGSRRTGDAGGPASGGCQSPESTSALTRPHRGTDVPRSPSSVRRESPDLAAQQELRPPTKSCRSTENRSTLYDVACSRSGDKGNNANVGIIARAAEDYGRLAQWLTAERVMEYFAPLGVDAVERYEMPNLGALNFVIHGVLRRRLRNDAQGKALGQALLEMPLDEDFHALS